MLYSFKADCSKRWVPLKEAVADSAGELVATLITEEDTYVDLVFPLYGAVVGIPTAEVEPAE